MPRNIDPSFVDKMTPNFAQLFLDRVAKSSSLEAYRFPKGSDWESVTWKQAGDRVSSLAAGLLSLGIQPEQRVGIASSTRYEWILADLAVMCAGGATTTVYPSTNDEDTAYIVGDSECQVVFAEDDVQIKKLADRRADLPTVAKVITFDGTTDGDWVISLDALADLGDKYLVDHPDAIATTVASIKPEQLATLIYTSGTTGRPKGVRLTHRAWVFEGAAIAVQDILDEKDLQFLWLPMAHSFGKVLLSAQLACGFATAIDGRVDKIVDNLGVVKPTFMGAAPRIFEKAHGRIITMQQAEGGVKEKIFNQAFKVGLEVSRRKRAGQSVPLPLSLQHGLFDKLVFSKIRDRFGGRVRFFISGAAALNQEIAEWFNAAGILILEGYGMTENAAGATVNHPDDYKMGTVGPAIPGSEIKLGDGDEVMIKGPHVMDGYHNNAGGDRQGAHPRRLAAHRRQGLHRRRRVPHHHRPDQGPLQDLRRQVHRPVGDRVEVQGALPLREPVRGLRRREELRRRADHPRRGRDGGLGDRERHGRQVVRRDRRLRPGPDDGGRLRRRAEREAEPLGDHQEVGAPRPRPLGRVG